MTSQDSPAVAVMALTKRYERGARQFSALADVTITIALGSFAVIRGPSGSGKSTLLNLIGGLDRPTAGTVVVCGQDLGTLGEKQVTAFRARAIGFVFQNFNLLPVLTALENVEYPLRLLSIGRRQRRDRAMAALEAVGLAREAGRRPGQLSGGQQQRVAVARALVKEPALVLADEPTANLDEENALSLVAQMRALQRSSGTTFMLSSHDPRVLGHTDTIVRLRNGRVVDEASEA